jgi:hypothetical protein
VGIQRARVTREENLVQRKAVAILLDGEEAYEWNSPKVAMCDPKDGLFRGDRDPCG